MYFENHLQTDLHRLTAFTSVPQNAKAKHDRQTDRGTTDKVIPMAGATKATTLVCFKETLRILWITY